MGSFKVRDLLMIGEVQGMQSALRERLGGLLDSSSNVRADVESLSTETGAYRLVLSGTLHQPETPTESEEAPVEALPVQAEDDSIGEIPSEPAEEAFP